MKFIEAFEEMKKGKKIYAKHLIYPIFITDYTDEEGTHKEICFELNGIHKNTLDYEDITSEEWEVVDE